MAEWQRGRRKGHSRNLASDTLPHDPFDLDLA
jgi:hypothetical protein